MEEESFAKSRVEEMIGKYGDVVDTTRDYEGRGFDVILLSNGTIIRLPAKPSRIDYDHVWLIADGKLQMSAWSFEEWLQNQGS